MCFKLGYFFTRGYPITLPGDGYGKPCPHQWVWVRVTGEIEGDGYRYGVAPPAPIPCGCHPYAGRLNNLCAQWNKGRPSWITQGMDLELKIVTWDQIEGGDRPEL